VSPLAKRPAARILLLDPDGRVLLFRFVPDGRSPFWATPGGALEPGESYAQGARRELIEETGIDADPGPEVARRVVQFTTLEGVPVEADERFFLVRASDAAIDTAGHTDLERRVMTSWRWFDAASLAALDERFFPVDLMDIIAAASADGNMPCPTI